MIVVKLQAATDANGNVTTIYVADEGYATGPADLPSDTNFDDGVIDPGSIGVSAFGDGRTTGATAIETGEVMLANNEGDFDAWINWSFDGRPAIIYQGEPGQPFPGGFNLVFVGTVEGIDADFGKAIVRLKDNQHLLEKFALPSIYAGTNVGPTGIDGLPTDLKGKRKPRVYGKVRNIPPYLVNASLLIYQVSDSVVQDISAVYDRGVALTKATNHTTLAALQGATIAAGSYHTCNALGLIRLNATPAGLVTADVTESASSVAQLLKRLATEAQAPSIDLADVANMDNANSAEAGVWVTEEATFGEVMDELSASVGAFYGFDNEGAFRCGILTAPTGDPVAEIDESECIGGIERRVANDVAVPAWRVTVRYGRIYAVQNSDLAGSVTATRRGELSNEYRTETVENPAIRTQWLMASELTVGGALVSQSAAAAEAGRLLALYSVRRDIFEATVPLDVVTDAGVRLLSVVSLSANRFGLSGGKSFRVIGLRYELANSRVRLTLWG